MMGLEIPNLDRYRFDRLTEEALAKLPAFSGEWNDFNTSDPGITIVELLAWFTDIDSYRFDRVTKKHRLAFLELVGFKPLPPVPSSVILHLSASGANRILPAGTRLAGNGIPFETLHSIKVSNAKISGLFLHGFGEEIRLGRMPLYPFGRFLRKGFALSFGFEESLSSSLRFFFKVRPMSLEPEGSASVSWRYCSDESGCKKPLSQWKKATLVEDGTCGLRKSGFVELSFASKAVQIAVLLEDERGYENLPLIEAVVPDAVEAIQTERIEAQELGVSSGYVNQRFEVDEGVDWESFELRVGQGVWSRVEALFGRNPDDEVYAVEGESIVFGDGGYGKIPPKGAKIVCSYRKCEGSRGNIAKGATWSFADGVGDFGAENPFEAEVGEDAKDMDTLFDSFGESLRRLRRAVTKSDHEALPLETPGTVLARVQADVDKRRNRITLTPIPKSEMKKPMPSTKTLERVEKFMRERALLTTKIAVAKPQYAEVSVAVSVRSDNFDEERIKKRVAKRLESYLHPLYGGESKRGWVEAKTLYISQLYLELIDLEGIASVEKMLVTVRWPDGRVTRRAEGSIEARKGVIFASGEHRVEVVVPHSNVCGGPL